MAKTKEEVRTYPPGFCLVIDTRESGKYLFQKPPKGLITVRDKLDAGDYSIRGFEDRITIERKHILDFYECLIKERTNKRGVKRGGRERFTRELKLMQQYEWSRILIHGTEKEVLDPASIGSGMHKNSVRSSIVSIEVKLGIPFYYAATKKDAERFILDRLLKYWRWKHTT